MQSSFLLFGFKSDLFHGGDWPLKDEGWSVCPVWTKMCLFIFRFVFHLWSNFWNLLLSMFYPVFFAGFNNFSYCFCHGPLWSRTLKLSGDICCTQTGKTKNIESQIIKDGKDLQDHLVQLFTCHQYCPLSIPPSTTTAHFWSTSRDGNPSTKVASLCQFPITLLENIFPNIQLEHPQKASIIEPLTQVEEGDLGRPPSHFPTSPLLLGTRLPC